MKKLILALLLIFVATIAFAQFFANWPETHESPSAAYIFAGIILITSLSLLVIGYRRENRKNQDNYHFREINKSEYDD
jgi:uncharacterized membrane protein YqhA